MTLAHYLYIPAIFLLGVLVGYIVRDRVQGALAEKDEEQKARAKARDARARARQADPSPEA